MNHGYKTRQELIDAQAQGKKFKFNGRVDHWYFNNSPSEYELVEEQSEPTSKKHKHADVIIAWANGEVVQVLDPDWRDVPHPLHPVWLETSEYRVKPKEETKYYVARANCLINSNKQDANVKMTFCGLTGNLLSVKKIK